MLVHIAACRFEVRCRMTIRITHYRVGTQDPRKKPAHDSAVKDRASVETIFPRDIDSKQLVKEIAVILCT